MNNKIARFLKEPKRYISKIIYKYFSWLLSDKQYLKAQFLYKFGYPLDLESPKTFCEKLQWLKLYDRNPKYTTMVDKYEVKKYVAEIIGEEYIIPTLAVWDKPQDIDWNTLPNQFVLKTTHGGGGNGVIICKDKELLDKRAIIKQLESSLDKDIYKEFREWPYKNVPKRIIAEKFMAPEKGQSDLTDYKIYCFNGSPQLIMVAGGRYSGDKRFAYYDTNWNVVDITWGAPRPDKEFDKPAQLSNMLKVASQLSKDMIHVRIDLYCIENNIFFGEITFFDSSGFEAITPANMDEYLGSLIKLPAKQQRAGMVNI